MSKSQKMRGGKRQITSDAGKLAANKKKVELKFIFNFNMKLKYLLKFNIIEQFL
jgi:hypothetical protein